jgi:2'-5' RNA ligase
VTTLTIGAAKQAASPIANAQLATSRVIPNRKARRAASWERSSHTTVKYSGALPQARVTELKQRVVKLAEEVKIALEQANSTPGL